ncbi:hypothetical protein HDU93_002789 [Gonapodya sp. JEL0774]|nr:hypothetical protein HDU93_002789 [Gonapodya sp. JEL0774]
MFILTNILSNLNSDLSHQVTKMGGQLVNLEHNISTIASSVHPIAVTLPNLTTKHDALNDVLHKLVYRLDTLEANMVTLGVEENPKDTDIGPTQRKHRWEVKQDSVGIE